MDNGKTPMEEGESSKHVKMQRRRKRGIEDFKIGEVQAPYDLLEDMKKKRLPGETRARQNLKTHRSLRQSLWSFQSFLTTQENLKRSSG